ncbi:unannotated protein [freshwater metagenome]|uniref:Unannotated protein n=2 Tax=freshwater metagenome TaxID=449393 RepID=A0A6J6DQG3_9ZZZZ|nr:hypothetical protein [Actinomycetota bacterium]MSY77996.1 hypothetical protein [Actinomycetota bacterium]MSZ15754.1 hypothetical protein [Actinomycetota bacterium]MSZ43040.1 hypothetical protein [Actinomycetota bacterium]MTA57169.1 hypothetical protein [Actinomycetota bacterium]
MCIGCMMAAQEFYLKTDLNDLEVYAVNEAKLLSQKLEIFIKLLAQFK